MEFVETHRPCPCGRSSDAYAIRADGSGFCFSCSKNHKSKDLIVTQAVESLERTEHKYASHRSLTEGTLRKYNILTKFKNEEPFSDTFVYTKEFSKIRLLKEKQYWSVGKATPGLFGKEAFPDPADILVITEGEYDAPSIFQGLGYHAVSVRSASSALSDVKADYEFCNRYKSIYLCFDNDDPGRDAVKKVAPLFDFKKVFVMNLKKYKDANEYLDNGDVNSLRAAFRTATKFVPEGVTSTFEEISSILEEQGRTSFCQIPVKALNSLLGGFALKESILLSGLEGIGKTELLRLFEHRILKDTDYNIGIVHLEESQKATINRLLSYELETPLLKPDVVVEKEKKLDAYRELVKRDNRVFYYSFFGEHDPDSILGIIRYLVTVCDCKVVFFDHINIVVSSLDQGSDERRALDYLCTKISSMLQELDFSFIFISHANDDGKTRGSRNISQTAHVHVRLERDIASINPMERRRLYLTVLKNRPTGSSGPAGYAYLDEDSGTLRDPDVLPDSEDYLEKIPS